MGLRFEWDAAKAKRNLRKHQVSFEEATTAFNDELSLTVPDPVHSAGEARCLLLGQTSRHRLIVIAFTEPGPDMTASGSSQPALPIAASAMTMKKAKRKAAPSRRAVREPTPATDEIHPHYDFSAGVRGKYAARYREGTNVVLLEPDVAERFPDAAAVNRALRVLANAADEEKPKSRSRHRTA